MSSPQLTGWASFRLGEVSPRLLIQSNFVNDEASTEYEVLLSDGCKVWRETLTNEQIISRARDIRCAIEPTDSENRQALFDLIRKSLSSDPDQRTGEVKLDFSAADDGQEFILRMSATLAPGLADLTWEVYLELLQPSAISTYLVDPLLVHASDLHAQVDLLVKELAAKDRVIERVCDRLEASGDLLTAVFPSKANLRLDRNKSQRLQLGPHVAGLGKFEAATWPERWQKVVHESDVEGSSRKAEVLQGLSAVTRDGQAEKEDGFWWRRIASTRVDKVDCGRKPDEAVIKHDNRSRVNDRGESTNSDNVDSAPHPPLPSRHQERSEEAAERPSKRLGAFGGRLRTTAAQHDDVDGDRSRTATASPVAEPEPTPEPVIKPKRLGAFGGRKPALETSAEATVETPQSSTTDVPSPPVKKAKIGTIGGKSKSTAADSLPESTISNPSIKVEPSTEAESNPPQSKIKAEETDDDSLRGRQKSETPSSRAKGETSQERADRKRQELKRELDEGVSTGASSKNVGVAKKKKRKF